MWADCSKVLGQDVEEEENFGKYDDIVTVAEDMMDELLRMDAEFFVKGSYAEHSCYMASPINFNQFLEKEKLKSNGSNFTDWFRHVRIFLNGGNLQYVLDAPLGDPPAETETDEVKNVYATRKTRYSQVQCAILCSLESDLQKRFEHHDPHELMKELKTIFETHAAVECYEASKHFFSCMMEEGSSISEHMLVMTGHAKKLSDLGIVIPNRLGINRVLQSLPPSYKNFVMNYNMQNMNKEFPELFGMLKAAEIEIKKEHQVLMVNKTTSFKKQGKSKGKFKKGGKKAATPPMKPKNGPKPDAECYYCKEKGHWKRNCSKSFTFRRRRSASAAAAMPRRGSSYRYGGVSSSGYRSVRARPKLRYFLLGTAPTIGSAGLGAFTPSLFHAQVFEMFLALFNTGSNLST
ncbi:hypothetical protein QYE76_023377 [Lolium multiflorum]|uniref:CCHC-type domain-containing protein n=1 Tax=Lolium multiflorum TaxID=4521 RepID=A0AAD8RBJ5_LOLMU|nr:hypothetical protein QYE76_023377 [Lolium multiflorum]